MRQHEQMIDALAAHDAAGLRELLVRHLRQKRDTVLALLQAGPLQLRVASAD